MDGFGSIVVIRIALLNRVDYMYRQHVPRLAAAEGVTEEQCRALNDWSKAEGWTLSERAALAYADAMTCNIEVADEVFNELVAYFDARQIVELTVLIGTYNMASRVLQALKIELEPPIA